uniref:UPF0506 domain-containing protein n=1 Tax=Globodera pallida TaxID=36090 RepID=A0A183BY20_GLOPA
MRVPPLLLLFLFPTAVICDDSVRSCKTQIDCAFVGGRICLMGLCVPAKCHLSSECPTGWDCTSEMHCLRSCFSAEDCGLIGWFCSERRVCVQGDCGKCRAGEKCVEGQCIPSWIRGMNRMD